jgi:NAD(P)H dehydrogenase (quinone)
MKKVLIITGHPDFDSLGSRLSEKYKEGAEVAGAEVREIIVRNLSFDPVLFHGYMRQEKLEEDILCSQELISWADHLVLIYPNWWGTYPALLKGFIDKVFWPDFAFRYTNGKLSWDKLLKGKSARVIITMDTPLWYYYLVQGSPGHKAIKRATLEFCGISPVRIISLAPVRNADEKKIESWLEKIYLLGKKIR